VRIPDAAVRDGDGPVCIRSRRHAVARGEGLPAKEITLADMFRSAGYATAHIGKWHLGSGVGHKPLDHGFDYSFGFMGGCIDNYTHFCYWAGPNRHDLWENNQRVRLPGRYFPDLMVEKAKAFIDRHRTQPFFMYFAMNMPHYPYQGEVKWLEHYRNLPYPRNLYAAFVSTLDERVQQLLKYLEESGLRERTIIVYQSDNGHSVEERAHFGGGSSGPYRRPSSASSKAASVCQRLSLGRVISPRGRCVAKSRTDATGCPHWQNYVK